MIGFALCVYTTSTYLTFVTLYHYLSTTPTAKMVAQSLFTLALIGVAVAAPGGGPGGYGQGGQQWGGEHTQS